MRETGSISGEIFMNDTELKCFIAVADNLSFTKAAQELYFSVSTVTHHVHMLEKELGTELFYRTNKSVSLTVEGQIFYMSAKLILDEENVAFLNLERGIQVQILRIGCTSNSEAFRTVPLLKKMISSYSQIIPEVHVDHYTRIIRMLDSGTLNFSFGPREMMLDTDLIFEEICSMGVYAVFNQDDPLAEGEGISFTDIQDNSLLIPGPKMVPFDIENPVIDKLNHHFSVHHDRMIDNESDGFPLVQAGYGIMVIPEYCVPLDVDILGIKAVPITDFQKFSYGMIYKSNRNIELKDFITDCCKNYYYRQQ